MSIHKALTWMIRARKRADCIREGPRYPRHHCGSDSFGQRRGRSGSTRTEAAGEVLTTLHARDGLDLDSRASRRETAGGQARRSAQAAAGQWGRHLQIADSPIHVERLGTIGSRAIFTPSLYKGSATPDPVIVELTTDDPKRPTWAVLRGDISSAPDAEGAALHQQIGDYLREHPDTSSSAVAKAIGNARTAPSRHSKICIAQVP